MEVRPDGKKQGKFLGMLNGETETAAQTGPAMDGPHRRSPGQRAWVPRHGPDQHWPPPQGGLPSTGILPIADHVVRPPDLSC